MKQTKSKAKSVPVVQSIPIPKTMRVIKVAKCHTLSGKETLTYQIGIDTDTEIYLMVTANSGRGYFSVEWVSLKATLALLEEATQPLTSYGLRHLYIGKSANNLAFLMAVLKHEGLVVPHKIKQRCFVYADPEPFMAELKQLQASDADIQAEDKAEQVPSFTQSTSIKKSAPIVN